MTSNPELDAAWRTIPERAATEEALSVIRQRLRDTPGADDPFEARDAVIGEAATAVNMGDPLPPDVGKRAAQAFLQALETHAERLAVVQAERALSARLEDLKDVWRDELLKVLGERLDDVTSQTRDIIARSGSITTAEAAITAGAVDEWKTLTGLVKRLEDIRQAARHVIASAADGANADRAQAYRRGHDLVRGLAADPAPDHIADALTGRVPLAPEHLLWLATSGRAYVPASEAELLGERVMPVIGLSDSEGPALDITPREFPIPQPPEPVRTGFEKTPDISLTARN